MDKDILSRYNSPEGATDYTKKFQRHWTERVNNWNEQRLLQHLLRTASIGRLNGWALDLPCGYGRLYYILRDLGASVVEGDWSFHLLGAARLFHADERNSPPPAGYVRATALSLPFRDRAFRIGFIGTSVSPHPRTSGTSTIFAGGYAGQSRMAGLYLFRYGVDKEPHSRVSQAIQRQTIEVDS